MKEFQKRIKILLFLVRLEAHFERSVIKFKELLVAVRLLNKKLSVVYTTQLLSSTLFNYFHLCLYRLTQLKFLFNKYKQNV